MEETDNMTGVDPVKSGFQSFEHAAADIVLAASFDSSGTRVALCSADHKIRIYNIDGENAWILADVWRGHDAEILDARIFVLPYLSKSMLILSKDPMAPLQPRPILRHDRR